MSETLAPDVLLVVAVLTIVLVGVGVMQPIALGGSGTTMSAACYLYRLRSSARLETTSLEMPSSQAG